MNTLIKPDIKNLNPKPGVGILFAWPAAIIILIAVPYLLSETWTQLFIFWGVNILLAQSINILSGYTGQISLGQAGFFAIGAYTSALLMMKLHFPFLIAVLIAIGITVLVGLVISFPAGRLREFYLAMVTIAFGLIVQLLLKQWTMITGGVMGLSGVPSPVLGNLSLFGLKLDLTMYYYISCLIVVMATWFQANLVRSYFGRAFMAVGECELASGALGINSGATKRLAYCISAGLAALGGAIDAHVMGYLGHEGFGLSTSIFILAMAIIGGLGTFIGPIIGAGFLTFVPHELQFLQEHQLLVYGLLLLVSFLVLPKGFAGIFRTRNSLIRRKAQEHKPESKAVREKAEVNTQVDRPLLSVNNISIDFGGVRALSGVSLDVDAGTIHGLIGPNGSGKSTLINVITGIYRPSGGVIKFASGSVSGLSPCTVSRLGIARTFQSPRIFKQLTVRENVLLGAHRFYKTGLLRCGLNIGVTVREEARLLRKTDEILERVGLRDQGDVMAGELPYGNQRMLELARALNGDPKLLFLDEPAAGLSEVELELLASVLRYLKKQGVTVFIIEHHLEFLFKLVEQVTVLESGQVIFDGLPGEVRSSSKVIEAYLGGYSGVGA